MSADALPPPPPYAVLADELARRCWDDDLRDDDRLRMEWAADAIRALMQDNLRHMNRAEHLEAYCHALMAQQGGAS